MSHGTPIKSQKYVLNIFNKCYIWIVVRIQKIHMIREPANTKNKDQNDQHFHNLFMEKKRKKGKR